MPSLDMIGHPREHRRANRDDGARTSRLGPAVNLADLERWFSAAAGGDALEYHRGYLAMDRVVGSRLGEHRRKELDRVAATVFGLAATGRGHPVQRRRGNGDYEYIFIIAPPPARQSATVPLRLMVAP